MQHQERIDSGRFPTVDSPTIVEACRPAMMHTRQFKLDCVARR